MKTHTSETQATVSPALALQFLKEGNARFVNNLRVSRDLLQQANETRDVPRVVKADGLVSAALPALGPAPTTFIGGGGASIAIAGVGGRSRTGLPRSTGRRPATRPAPRQVERQGPRSGPPWPVARSSPA